MGKNATILSMIFSSMFLGAFYVLTAFFLRQKHLYLSLVCLGCWLLAGAAFVGFLSALVVNISPIQFVTLCFAQSLAIVVYTRVSIRKMVHKIAVMAMLGATLVVWLVSIYGFVVENDWMAATVILLLSFFVVIYNHRYLLHVKNAGYSTAWESTAEAIIHYYCMDAIRFVDAITRCAEGKHIRLELLEGEDDFEVVEPPQTDTEQ
jgi:hypothetical protein